MHFVNPKSSISSSYLFREVREINFLIVIKKSSRTVLGVRAFCESEIFNMEFLLF